MPRTITVTLTLDEARAARYALGGRFSPAEESAWTKLDDALDAFLENCPRCNHDLGEPVSGDRTYG